MIGVFNTQMWDAAGICLVALTSCTEEEREPLRRLFVKYANGAVGLESEGHATLAMEAPLKDDIAL